MGKVRVTKEFHKNFNYQFDKLAAVANGWVFQPYIKPTDSVLHFWCGGGYLLKSLVCGEKYGVDVSPKYTAHAQTLGIHVASTLNEFKNLDVVITMHSLSRIPDPMDALTDSYQALKDGGTLVVLVPCCTYKIPYSEFNFERHLYSWSPIDIGNLVHRAGFKILSVERICHRIPPKGQLVLRVGGEKLFHLLAKIWGWLRPDVTQIRVVATKLPAV